MVYTIYLGLEVGIWEPLWAQGIYHIPTWILWEGKSKLQTLNPKTLNRVLGWAQGFLSACEGFLRTFIFVSKEKGVSRGLKSLPGSFKGFSGLQKVLKPRILDSKS